LNGFDITAIPALLDQISPEELGAIYSIGFVRMNNTVGSLQNRFADIRSLGEKSLTAERDSNGSTSSAKSAKQAQVLPPSTRNRYGSFTTASGGFSSREDTSNASGYDSESGILLSGFDVRISDPLTLGVLVGYARTESDLNSGGEIEVDGGSLALYGQYVREDWFVESMIGGSYNRYETERQALSGIAGGDTQGGGFDAYLSLGKDLKRDGLTVTPFASLLYTRVGIDGYDENGSLQPLYIENQAADSLSSRIGLRAARAYLWNDAVMTPYASAQWQHEYLDDASAVDYSFANGSGSKSTAYGPEIGRNSLLLGGGVQIAWEHFACYLSYQADLGRENYENQSVLTGFRVTW
jgi:outer membrane autotransporter protein